MKFITIFSLLSILSFSFCWAGEYVGSKKCGECHETEYKNFITYSKKAKSYEHIKKMFPKLTPAEKEQCFRCHTTAYKRGGFISYAKTPHLSDVGCETCHGPGRKHVESGGDPEFIRLKPSLKQCAKCHNTERVRDFRFRPLLYGGVH
ncbi:MAG: cytochrome c family protein [Desulfonauticus sp.]|nr:cytochrome c family protein [Desulfonauticus sp.]